MKNKLNEILDSLDKKQFIDYYTNHNIKDTAKQFNISTDRITQICRQIGFKKDIQSINKQIKATKEKRFGSIENLNKHNLEKRNQSLLLKYGSKERAKEERIKKFKATISKKENNFNSIINNIDKDEFIDLYINQNKSRAYIQNKYKLSSYMLDKVINYYKCNKTHAQSSELSLQSKYSKFIDKENYFNYLVNKIKIAKIKHYGSWENALKATSESCKNSWLNKSKEELDAIRQKTKETNMLKYGVESCYQLANCRLKGNNSKPNKSFSKLLDINDIKYIREYPIANRSYDFKVDNILIEINPSVTHNSTYGIYDNKPLATDYHKNKSTLAEENSYRCIHIWDWDNKQKIVDSLKHKKIIFARKCELKNISKIDLDEFLNQYHFQNTCKNQSIRLGLYYQDELVQVMSFGKPRFNKNYQYELLRLCTQAKYRVVGGSEKLFKYFLDNYNPESIISYCDNSKFNGNIYNKLGFELINKGIPSKHWYNIKTKKHILDSSLRAKGFDILLGKEYGCFGKGVSNDKLMLEHGFIEVYDCGQSSYKYRREIDGRDNRN